ncbi:hypothetical protein [Acanthamoeba polyphaga mimivirus]|nr:hypothetical protein [Acanthamoeba castellanii mamavirus]EJN40985.1 hypothetical protein lvs_R482 [Acanthamoeba polyphaga lentillevirus]UMZ07911.1 hypothetical protein [Acanthamoeba polyphaga mimivirus]
MSQVTGFDQSNVAQYSSFDPLGSLEHAGSNLGNFIQRNNPFPSLSHSASHTFDDVRSDSGKFFDELKSEADKFYDDAKHGLSDIDYRDFYASDPGNTALRASMQSPYLNSYMDINNAPNVIPLQAPPIVTNRNSKDYNILFVVVILLLLFVAWRCYVNKR